MQEIVLPDNIKPALEWVNNRVLQKVSPTPRHALAQLRVARVLSEWAEAGNRGFVGTEVRFQLQPPGEIRRTLVPDVAFVSFERTSSAELEEASAIQAAPDVVVEVRSPDDRQADIDEKVRVFLAAGTSAVFLIDLVSRSVVAADAFGVHDLSRGPLEHTALPGFSMDPSIIFEMPKPRHR